MKVRRIFAPTVCAVMLYMTGCGGGDGGNGASPTPTPAPTATVSGTAAKGLLLNAIISFYSVTDGVQSATSITTVRTDATTGAFSTSVSSAGPVVVTVTTDATTQMLDEISGTAITAPTGLILHAVFDSVTDLKPISVTPLTEMAYDIAKSTTGALTTTNIDAANNEVSTAFLAGAPVLYTQPINIKNYAAATAAEQELAKLLTALAVAANEGIATGSSGSPCVTTYSANIVCLIGGLGNLLTVNSSGAITLSSAANYISSAYLSIDSGAVTIAGGQTPGALGLNVVTGAETSFLAAIAKQAPLPGYDAGANPLANTKALFANIRTNIIDQAATQTFGYAPTLTALQNDFNTNVYPISSNTSSLLGSAYKAAQLIGFGTVSTAALGTPSPNINSPVALAADASGNFYVINANLTIAKVTTAGAVIYAGQPGLAGATNGAAAQATFTNPTAIALDSSGNVYVADDNTIREITPAGVVSTLAGQAGISGSSDGMGSAASFGYPAAITVDGSGNVFVADSGNYAIRVISPGGVVTTLPIPQSSLPSTSGIAVDSAGNIYVTEPGTVQKITPTGISTLLAGQSDTSGYSDGTGAAAEFAGPSAITIDASGNLYVIDSGNFAIRKITPDGVVTTLAKTKSQGSPTDTSSFGYLTGIALDPFENVYVSDAAHSSIQEITTTGAINTLIHNLANYEGGCGYDPVGLHTATDVALCRYGLTDGEILLTVTQTAAGTYELKTQALYSTPSTGSIAYNPIFSTYAYTYSVNTSLPALQSAFTWTTSASGAQSATFSGPYYVNSTGGTVQGAISAAESSDWNAATGTGSISVSGTLSGGAGGVSLVNATIGSDSVITLQNVQRLLSNPSALVVSASSPAVSISGILDLTHFTTDAFSYAVKANIGAPVYDKSKALALPGTASITGSITQFTADGSIPLFNGAIGVSFEGLPSFDATQPISSTNYFTAQAQLTGTLSFTGGRVLTVSATANGTQRVATPTLPDSMSASYSYVTPSGTAALNATGQYNATNGYSGTITNNSGVVISVTEPIGGKLTGTVTANGAETATINGVFVFYSDGTSESLF